MHPYQWSYCFELVLVLRAAGPTALTKCRLVVVARASPREVQPSRGSLVASDTLAMVAERKERQVGLAKQDEQREMRSSHSSATLAVQAEPEGAPAELLLRNSLNLNSNSRQTFQSLEDPQLHLPPHPQ